MQFVSLFNKRTEEKIATTVMIADSFWSRFRGLLGRPALKPFEGLWLIPCNQVHMFGMQYPLSIWFVTSQGKICQIIDYLEPGKISPRVKDASSILELPASWAKITRTQVGDTLLHTYTKGIL